jgi:MFS family permease
MLSLTKPHKYFQTFLSQGVGMGLGMGLMFIPALSITSHYFRKRRSVAIGYVFAGWKYRIFSDPTDNNKNRSGSSIGGIIYPIMLNHLFHDKAGFAWAVR